MMIYKNVNTAIHKYGVDLLSACKFFYETKIDIVRLKEYYENSYIMDIAEIL